MVIFSHGSFTFKYLDSDSSLLVLVSSEGLTLLGWDDSSSGYDFSHDSSNSFNSKSKWSHINKKNIFNLFILISS